MPRPEYDFPFLIVRELATKGGSEEEKITAHWAIKEWESKHPSVGGHVGVDRTGYQFYRPTSSRERGSRRQFIPDMPYIDRRTWSRLSAEEKEMAYFPCVPAVVIERKSASDKLEDLQDKVSKFISCGTREGVVIDTRGNQVWIYNRGQQPYFEPLGTIQFDNWPGFELDCIALRDARIQAGFK